MKYKLLILLFFVNASIFAQNIWRPMGPDDFNQASHDNCSDGFLAIDNFNIPYFAYNDKSFPDGGSLTIRKFVNGTWQTVGSPGFTTFTPQRISLTFDLNNLAYLCCLDQNAKCYVRKLDGNTWIDVGPQGIVMASPMIKFNSQNELHIAGFYQSNNALRVKKFNGTSWDNVGDNVFANINESKFYFDTNDVPYVVYTNYHYDLNQCKISVKKLSGQNWIAVGNPSFSIGGALDIQLQLNSGNEPYVAYRNMTFYNKALCVQKFNGTAWVNAGTTGITNEEVTNVSLKIDANDIPYVAATSYSSGSTYVKRLDNEAWIDVGEKVDGDARTIAFDNQNTLHLAVNYTTGKVRKFNGTEWDLLGDNEIASKHYIPLMHGNDTFISEWTGENGFIKKWTGTDWTQVATVALPEPSYNIRNLVTDSNDEFYVSSRGANNLLKITKVSDASQEIINTTQQTPEYNSKFIIDGNDTKYVFMVTDDHYTDNNRVILFKKSSSDWTQSVIEYDTSADGRLHAVVGTDNIPYVALKSLNYGDKVIVKKFNGVTNSWDVLGGAPITQENPMEVQLLLDKQNTPYLIACFSLTPYHFEIYKFVQDSWHLVNTTNFNITTFNFTGKFAFDNNNILHVSYLNTNMEIAVRKFVNNTWELVGVEGFPAAKANHYNYEPALYFLNDNVPVVIYFTTGTFARYYGPQEALSMDVFDAKAKTGFIYPNPVTDKLYFSDPEGITGVQIFDLLGKKVSEYNSILDHIDFDFDPGWYIVRVQAANSETTYKIYKK